MGHWRRTWSFLWPGRINERVHLVITPLHLPESPHAASVAETIMKMHWEISICNSQRWGASLGWEDHYLLFLPQGLTLGSRSAQQVMCVKSPSCPFHCTSPQKVLPAQEKRLLYSSREVRFNFPDLNFTLLRMEEWLKKWMLLPCKGEEGWDQIPRICINKFKVSGQAHL